MNVKNLGEIWSVLAKLGETFQSQNEEVNLSVDDTK